MNSPLETRRLVEFESIESTQTEAAQRVGAGEIEVGGIYSHHQTAGLGRIGKSWFSEADHSLAVSLIFWDYADHDKPWLIGMNLAVAVAGAMHTRISWPNDLMLGSKKVGGILTNLYADPSGRRIPVVGLGLNLQVTEFPDEIKEIAGNVETAQTNQLGPREVLQRVLDRLQLLPEPTSWKEISPVWGLFDQTAGKQFRLPSGEIAIGIAVGADAELICSVDGETTTLMAAEAIFGSASE